MSSQADRIGRAVVVFVGAVLAAAAGWLLFVAVPAGNLARLLGIVLVIATAVLGLRFAGRVASQVFALYNVAEVAVEGPIVRDATGGLPRGPSAAVADPIVEQIERADEDSNVGALLLKLNTPGGEVVPSDDIRLAAERFDGPTVAYATDVCASGGYWIASGCDELWARDASVVGSIGVIGSTVNAKGLADKLGLSYERFAAGKFKDAGMALKDLSDDERDYLQGIIDDYYDHFVDRVTDGRDLDPEAVRDTEARVYLGEEAYEIGLVDALGTREDVEEYLEESIGEPVEVREFAPEAGFVKRLRGGAAGVAYAFGAGLASVVGDDDTGGSASASGKSTQTARVFIPRPCRFG
ncbi:signal peptide peptidase SppA [Halobacteriaceae archaeon GCM10025711]